MKKNNAIKTIISLSLAIIMIFAISIPVFAAESEESTVTPRWTSIATMDVDIGFLEAPAMLLLLQENSQLRHISQ